MPIYFFTVKHDESERGHDGIVLANDEAAWAEATTACGEMIRDLDGDLKPGHEWLMEVKRESGKLVYRLRFTAEKLD